MLPIEQSTGIAAMLPLPETMKDKYLIMLTRKGFIKRTPLINFRKVGSRGIGAINIRVSYHRDLRSTLFNSDTT